MGYYEKTFPCAITKNNDWMSFRLRARVTEQNIKDNKSTVNFALEVKFTKSGNKYLDTSPVKVTVGFNINRLIFSETKVLKYSINDIDGEWHNVCFNTGYIFTHNDNGTKTIRVSTLINDGGTQPINIGDSIYSPGKIILNSTEFTLPPIPRYHLSINNDTNSAINVKRTTTQSNQSLTGLINGDLKNESLLTFNDVLNIAFKANSGYTLTTHNVNGSTYNLNNTSYTVTGDVNVSSIASLSKLYTPSTVVASNVDYNNSITNFSVTKSDTALTTKLLLMSNDGIWEKSINLGSSSSGSYTFTDSDKATLGESISSTDQTYVTILVRCTTYNGETIIKNGVLDYTESSFKIYLKSGVSYNIGYDITDSITNENLILSSVTIPKVTIYNLEQFKDITSIYISNSNSINNSDKLLLSYPVSPTSSTSYSRTFDKPISENVFYIKIEHANGVYENEITSNNYISDYFLPTVNVEYISNGVTNTQSNKTSGNIKVSGYLHNSNSSSITLKYEYKANGDNNYILLSTKNPIITQQDTIGKKYSSEQSIINLSTNILYQIKVTVTDSYGRSNSNIVNTTGVLPLFDWNNNDFKFNIPVKIVNGLDIYGDISKLRVQTGVVDSYPIFNSVFDAIKSEILDYIYPVGSIYMTTQDINPHNKFGGIWKRIEGRFLLGASTEYAAGTEDGEKSHQLTINEMPSHHHSVKIKYGAKSGSGDDWRLHPQIGKYVFNEGYNSCDDTGGGQPHNNMPPYLAVYIWKRTE